ncbi:alpha/beta fold hydrolase [Blastococcus sp. SYSU DS0619]
MDVLLPGITTTRVATPRLTQNLVHPAAVEPAGLGAADGEVVLFVHGNVSSALFWQQPMLALVDQARVRPVAVDLRGYGDTDPLPVDARRGVRDWADDVAALVETLGVERVHLVGWSMGAGVVLQ